MSDVDATVAGTASADASASPAAPAGPSPLDHLSNVVSFLRHGDLGLAVGVITILVVMILPLPSAFMDMFLAISIIFSVLILMTSLFIRAPLEFSSFPTILLVTTMLRLALNLASTRLILANGHEGAGAAGNVIEAFGNFVTRGNFVIGVIVFAILVTVNFVVITKGSGRIAEVAARFTLDAMPGKQMAIDADLSAGLINEQEAKQRRTDLSDESAFFGSMDGASKFVRGDAIAGLIITFINVIGGIVIGVAQKDMAFSDAAQAYTLLTIGDGLVSQIPALIVSTAAGILVSKSGVSGSADKALMRQLSGYPKALGMSSAVMIIMAFLPGMPLVPFMTLGIGAGYLAYKASNKHKLAAQKVVADKLQVEQRAAEPPAEEPISQVLKMDELRLELGYGLISMANGADSQALTDQIKALRRQLASEMGFVMPAVRIMDNVQLHANDYILKVKEVEVGRGVVYPKQFMTMDPSGADISLPGIQTTEPTFGLPATWIDGSLREEAAILGLTVVDPATVISTHLTEIIKANMDELLSYAVVQGLLDELPGDQKKLIDDIVPGQITVSGIQRVLQSLLSERISIRDLSSILEGIADASGFTRSVQSMTEHVRARLSLQICANHQAPGGYLPILTLSPAWEQEFNNALIGDGDEKQLAMAPSKLQEFVGLVRDGFEDAAQIGEIPVLLTSPGNRPYVRSIIERFRAHTTVLSQSEIHTRIRLKTVGSI
ncbi:flagellar biosynthesis protein FlhA [Cohaesibacter celericrescens]|uniref:Flagellar biosynthesis protein FlhA n=1 Tax=Cohaesibacter celericrescens TaxID=2067669 RepID=A0A2N5XMG3_9HYPH|nr:flagellar biosynthesis protein FlhA [Cohaesibacter celericrescens]PLW75607.1 flagellar biosynthesis protein FlhA [Cohaesibacter celericrescens]